MCFPPAVVQGPLLAALPRSSVGAQGLERPCHLHPISRAQPLGTCTLGSGSMRPQAQPHCPPWRGPAGSPSAHTLARAMSRRPRRERRSRRNRRAASGTSTARSCRSRLWDRDRTSRSCGGTDGQVDGQMGGRQAERGHTDRRRHLRLTVPAWAAFLWLAAGWAVNRISAAGLCRVISRGCGWLAR